MQENYKYIENENYYLINNKIKIDPKYLPNLIKKRNLENLKKLKDNLYYYKSKSLIEILFDVNDYDKIKFKNNDFDDYSISQSNKNAVPDFPSIFSILDQTNGYDL